MPRLHARRRNLGRVKDCHWPLLGSAGSIVLHLVENLQVTNKNYKPFMDRFYNSVALFHLLKNKLEVLAGGHCHAKAKSLPQGTWQEADHTWPIRISNMAHTFPSFHLTTEQKSTLYFSYVQPLIDYGLTIYGHCSATLLDKVLRFQNRCARFTTKIFDYDVRSKDLLIKLRWMNITQRRDFLIGILTFKCLYGLAPNYLSDPLVYTHDIHSHNSRQAAQNCLFVPSGRTTYFQHSFQVQGTKLWNTLTPYIKEAPTPEIFKYRYRQWLFTNTS